MGFFFGFVLDFFLVIHANLQHSLKKSVSVTIPIALFRSNVLIRILDKFFTYESM